MISNESEPNYLSPQLAALDRFIVGSTEPPVSVLTKSGTSPQLLTITARNRLLAFGSQAFETGFQGLQIFGFHETAPHLDPDGSNIPIVAIIGLVGEITAYMAKNETLNTAGSTTRIAVSELLTHTRTHKDAITGHLLHAGFTPMEIKSLDRLPTDLYQGVFGTTSRTTLANWEGPIVAGTALALASGEPTIGATLALTGLAALPIGRILFQRLQGVQHRTRLAAESKQTPHWLNTFKKDHIPQAQLGNFLSTLPKVFQAVALASGVNNLASFLTASTTGLAGYFGLQPAAKSREANVRLTELTERFIASLNDPWLLLMPANARAHAERDGIPLVSLPSPDFSGLSVRGLQPTTPDGRTLPIGPINFDLESGKTLILQGGSGKGKSELYSTLTHAHDHVPGGQVVISHNGHQTNLHELLLKEHHPQRISELIDSVPRSSFSDTDQLADIFTSAFNLIYDHPEFSDPVDQAAWEAAIVLPHSSLTHELELYHEPKYRPLFGKFNLSLEPLRIRPAYSDKVMAHLADYQTAKLDWIKSQLVNTGEGSNLNKEGIDSDRLVNTLSAGEVKYLQLIAQIARAQANPKLQVVLLDEPLAGLDHDTNLPLVIERIRFLSTLNGGLATLLITHDQVSLLQREFDANYLNLDKNIYTSAAEFAKTRQLQEQALQADEKRQQLADIWQRLCTRLPADQFSIYDYMTCGISPVGPDGPQSHHQSADYLFQSPVNIADAFVAYWADKLSSTPDGLRCKFGTRSEFTHHLEILENHITNLTTSTLFEPLSLSDWENLANYLHGQINEHLPHIYIANYGMGAQEVIEYHSSLGYRGTPTTSNFKTADNYNEATRQLGQYLHDQIHDLARQFYPELSLFSFAINHLRA